MSTIAVFCSDVHLSHKPPIARSAEPDWYAAMSRVLDQVRELADGTPVLYAGDIFDRWSSPPELINFAMKRLPTGYAIPGQHDLPEHSYEQIHRSAYSTLCQAGVLQNIKDSTFHQADWSRILEIYDFHWGKPVSKCPVKKNDEQITIALVHAYCWKMGFSYPDAPTEAHVDSLKDISKTWDYIVCGDNHEGFIEGNIVNCGGLMLRRSDEINRKPFITILQDDGSIKQHFLDTSKDKWIDKEDIINIEKEIDIESFLNELIGLESGGLDFREAVTRFIDDKRSELSDGTRKILLEAIS